MTDELGNDEVSPLGAEPPAAATASAAAPADDRHRVAVGTLFALATIIGIVAVLAVWANRQVLSTDSWTNMSSKVLGDQHVRNAVAAYTVSQLFSSGVVHAQVKSALPTQFQRLAGPITERLEHVAGRLAPKLFASPQAQDAWRLANRAAHTTFMKIIEGGGNVANTHGGLVTLNLRALVDQLAKNLGVKQQVAAALSKLRHNADATQSAATKVRIALPPSGGQLVIMRSSQLTTAQDIASAIKGLAIVLPVVTFALFVLAVWLARDRRLRAVRMTGWCFVAIGLITLLARRVLGNYIVNSLVKNPDNKTAAHDVWTIGTTMLYDIAVAVVIFGLILIVATWLAGRATLRDRRAPCPDPP
jgi:hypothetical protein